MGLVRPPIVFYAFDLLRLNGKDLQGLPIEQRKAKLEASNFGQWLDCTTAVTKSK
jgi:ATP-dependent DNA ligase